MFNTDHGRPHVPHPDVDVVGPGVAAIDPRVDGEAGDQVGLAQVQGKPGVPVLAGGVEGPCQRGRLAEMTKIPNCVTYTTKCD